MLKSLLLCRFPILDQVIAVVITRFSLVVTPQDFKFKHKIKLKNEKKGLLLNQNLFKKTPKKKKKNGAMKIFTIN